MSRLRSSEGVKVEGPRCPYCHDDVRGEDEKHGCSSCMAWHHLECWNEAGERCATCGQTELEVLADEEEELEVLPEPAAEYPGARPPRWKTAFAIALAVFYGILAAAIAGAVTFPLGVFALPIAVVAYYFAATWIYKRLR